jgi:hypothetical protein
VEWLQSLEKMHGIAHIKILMNFILDRFNPKQVYMTYHECHELHNWMALAMPVDVQWRVMVQVTTAQTP